MMGQDAIRKTAYAEGPRNSVRGRSGRTGERDGIDGDSPTGEGSEI